MRPDTTRRHSTHDSAFAPHEVLAGKDPRTLARELLGKTQEECSRAFKGSPVKRAKLRGLKRNASVVLGNVGSPDDVPALVAVLADEEPMVPLRPGGCDVARIS